MLPAGLRRAPVGGHSDSHIFRSCIVAAFFRLVLGRLYNVLLTFSVKILSVANILGACSLLRVNVTPPIPVESKPLLNVRDFLEYTKVSRPWVRPAIPTREQWLPLSNLDRVVNPTFSSLILFFEKNSVKSRRYADVAAALRKSLEEVLVEFYPLAGQLKLREDGLVDLFCNDRGAMFFEASVDIELAKLGELKPIPELSGLEAAQKSIGPGPLYLPDQLTPIPVLVVQLTRFKCNSIALAVNWHHTVADGSAGCHFIKSWAEVADERGISMRPNHDRTILKPRTPLDPSLVNQYGYSTRDVREDFFELPHSASKSPVNSVCVIQRDKVTSIKRLAKAKSNDRARGGSRIGISSAESISAFMWRAMTKARYADSAQIEQARTTRFFVFVDGRKKLGIPAGYFGNVICSACAISTEAEIARRPHSYAAGLIRAATMGINADYFQSLIDWVEVHGLNGSSKSDHVNSLGYDVATTFWNYFPIYDMDFGWGKPTFGARNSPPRRLIDGFAVMPSNKRQGDMIHILNLNVDRLERLKRDAEFSKYVDFFP